MHPKLEATLKFLKIIDEDKTVSLTSVALIVVLGKLVVAPAMGITEIGALLVALMSYQGKKVINHQAPKEPNVLDTQVDEMKAKLEEVESKVSVMSLAAGLKRNG